jgi:hypothetical protein
MADQIQKIPEGAGFDSYQTGRLVPTILDGQKIVLVDSGQGYFWGPFSSQSDAKAYADTLVAQKTGAANSATDAVTSVGQNFFNGTPAQQQAAQDTAYGTSAQQQSAGENWAAHQAFGLDPGTVVTHGGQTILDPYQQPGTGVYQQPGALADQTRGRAAIAAQHGTDVAAHNSAANALLGDYKGAVGGYTSALGGISLPDSVAAQAQADPQSIAAQMQAINMLMGAAGGSQDVHTNPQDLARQQQAADKEWALTDPQMTAAERFIMEQTRGAQERDQRAAMDAALQNLQATGMLGSGAQVGAMLGAGQQTSQNRLLGDLGAQAQAVNRSMQALGLYSNLATSMRNASDAMSTGNADRRVGAASSAGGLAGQARGQSFNEAYNRGSAADARSQAQTNLAVEKADKTLGANRDLFGASQGVNDGNYAANTSVSDLASKQLGDAWGQGLTATNWFAEDARRRAAAQLLQDQEKP